MTVKTKKTAKPKAKKPVAKKTASSPGRGYTCPPHDPDGRDAMRLVGFRPVPLDQKGAPTPGRIAREVLGIYRDLEDLNDGVEDQLIPAHEATEELPDIAARLAVMLAALKGWEKCAKIGFAPVKRKPSAR